MRRSTRLRPGVRGILQVVGALVGIAGVLAMLPSPGVQVSTLSRTLGVGLTVLGLAVILIPTRRIHIPAALLLAVLVGIAVHHAHAVIAASDSPCGCLEVLGQPPHSLLLSAAGVLVFVVALALYLLRTRDARRWLRVSAALGLASGLLALSMHDPAVDSPGLTGELETRSGYGSDVGAPLRAQHGARPEAAVPAADDKHEWSIRIAAPNAFVRQPCQVTLQTLQAGKSLTETVVPRRERGFLVVHERSSGLPSPPHNLCVEPQHGLALASEIAWRGAQGYAALTLPPEGQIIRGIVRDVRGHPVSGVAVVLAEADFNATLQSNRARAEHVLRGETIGRAISDSGGEFSLEGWASEQVAIDVVSPDYARLETAELDGTLRDRIRPSDVLHVITVGRVLVAGLSLEFEGLQDRTTDGQLPYELNFVRAPTHGCGGGTPAHQPLGVRALTHPEGLTYALFWHVCETDAATPLGTVAGTVRIRAPAFVPAEHTLKWTNPTDNAFAKILVRRADDRPFRTVQLALQGWPEQWGEMRAQCTISTFSNRARQTARLGLEFTGSPPVAELLLPTGSVELELALCTQRLRFDLHAPLEDENPVVTVPVPIRKLRRLRVLHPSHVGGSVPAFHFDNSAALVGQAPGIPTFDRYSVPVVARRRKQLEHTLWILPGLREITVSAGVSAPRVAMIRKTVAFGDGDEAELDLSDELGRLAR